MVDISWFIITSLKSLYPSSHCLPLSFLLYGCQSIYLWFTLDHKWSHLETLNYIYETLFLHKVTFTDTGVETQTYLFGWHYSTQYCVQIGLSFSFLLWEDMLSNRHFYYCSCDTYFKEADSPYKCLNWINKKGSWETHGKSCTCISNLKDISGDKSMEEQRDYKCLDTAYYKKTRDYSHMKYLDLFYLRNIR